MEVNIGLVAGSHKRNELARIQQDSDCVFVGYVYFGILYRSMPPLATAMDIAISKYIKA